MAGYSPKSLTSFQLTPLSFSVGEDRQQLTLPLRLNANFRGHTRSRARRHEVRNQRAQTRLFLDAKAHRPQLPCVVRLVRIAPRTLDADDNLPTAFKAVKDGICDWFGIDDRKGCPVTWKYAQERGPARTYGCRIELTAWVSDRKGGAS